MTPADLEMACVTAVKTHAAPGTDGLPIEAIVKAVRAAFPRGERVLVDAENSTPIDANACRVALTACVKRKDIAVKWTTGTAAGMRWWAPRLMMHIELDMPATPAAADLLNYLLNLAADEQREAGAAEDTARADAWAAFRKTLNEAVEDLAR